MPTELLERIRGEIRRSFHGPAWYGPALLEALADLSAAEALRHPIKDAHSVAELLLHCLAWTEEVTRRLSGGEAALPERGDWPPVPELDAAAWLSFRHTLETAAEALDQGLASFPSERLHERVGGPVHDPPLGSGVPFEVMLHGLAQHNAYHAGQIALLRRALRP
ncbi:MAG: DinB family protein [Thermoanaerobaculia bacterium]